jgi:hypothetical protein
MEPKLALAIAVLSGILSVLNIAAKYREVKKSSPASKRWARQDEINRKQEAHNEKTEAYLRRDFARLDALELRAEKNSAFQRLVLTGQTAILKRLGTGDHSGALNKASEDIAEYLRGLI